jgi:hypothetical protein
MTAAHTIDGRVSTWRRRLRFSLKTLLVIIAVFSLWLGYTSHRARQQKQVVHAILSAGRLDLHSTLRPRGRPRHKEA